MLFSSCTFFPKIGMFREIYSVRFWELVEPTVPPNPRLDRKARSRTAFMRRRSLIKVFVGLLYGSMALSTERLDRDPATATALSDLCCCRWQGLFIVFGLWRVSVIPFFPGGPEGWVAGIGLMDFWNLSACYFLGLPGLWNVCESYITSVSVFCGMHLAQFFCRFEKLAGTFCLSRDPSLREWVVLSLGMWNSVEYWQESITCGRILPKCCGVWLAESVVFLAHHIKWRLSSAYFVSRGSTSLSGLARDLFEQDAIMMCFALLHHSFRGPYSASFPKSYKWRQRAYGG